MVVHWKFWCWSWNSNTLSTWYKELTHLQTLWCWERLRAGGEEDDREWDGWMASPTQWTCVWVDSGNWWWTGRPGVLRFMGSQRVRHTWETELNWTEQWETLFSWAPKSLKMVTAAMKLKDGCSLEGKLWQPRQRIRKQRYHFSDKVPYCQSSGLSSSHVWMWTLDHKEVWVPEKWCFWTAVLEKTLESPLDCKEIKPVNPQGNQSWIFIGRIDTEAEVPIFWPRYAKSWFIGKNSDAGRDWGHKEKGTKEDEMFGWHHWLDGHEFEQALGDSEGQGSLGCCNPSGHKQSHTS